MTLISGHVIVVSVIAIGSVVLGMAHVLTGTDVTNVYIAGIASFSVHGVTATVAATKRNGSGP